MKKVLVFLLACFACTAMFAQTTCPWSQNSQGCTNTNTSFRCQLYINEEHIENPTNFQIGVFDQTETCRGTKQASWVNAYGYYYYNITCKGYAGCEYHFRIWDLERGEERTDLVFSNISDYTEFIWQPGNFSYGTGTNPFPLNFNMEATGITKDIIGYEDEGVEDMWYFLSSPIGAIEDATTVTNLFEGEYDFYKFDQKGDADGYEWMNYEAGEFTGFELGKGYLYAKQNGCTITFNGTAYTGEIGTFDLDYYEDNADDNMWGWNLMGNPYNEYATVDKEGYVIEDAVMVPYTDMLAPMEGIMVKANGEGENITFTPDETGGVGGGIGDLKAMFALNVTSGSKLVDRAVVRFGQGGQLPKFQLKESTKVYIPMDGEEYSVVRSEGMGELPVSFKATKNGSYTMCINSKNVSFGYLHLIDNLTGADQDLLANPSYSFEAKTTDYASRFKLVFATGNTEDDFAFFSNGSLVINNEGNATLQVVDVTGRIIKCENINGCASVNIDAASGVYMIRLVNGDNVKVQKVVK
ncbi:MAG: T9SS type A sorting domain-containing protein [Bacteroidales bacterium]|nr:T9SS type A sorting domain-containing protein [Bacteroidales bacterium]